MLQSMLQQLQTAPFIHLQKANLQSFLYKKVQICLEFLKIRDSKYFNYLNL